MTLLLPLLHGVLCMCRVAHAVCHTSSVADCCCCCYPLCTYNIGHGMLVRNRHQPCCAYVRPRPTRTCREEDDALHIDFTTQPQQFRVRGLLTLPPLKQLTGGQLPPLSITPQVIRQQQALPLLHMHQVGPPHTSSAVQGAGAYGMRAEAAAAAAVAGAALSFAGGVGGARGAAAGGGG